MPYTYWHTQSKFPSSSQLGFKASAVLEFEDFGALLLTATTSDKHLREQEQFCLSHAYTHSHITVADWDKLEARVREGTEGEREMERKRTNKCTDVHTLVERADLSYGLIITVGIGLTSPPLHLKVSCSTCVILQRFSTLSVFFVHASLSQLRPKCPICQLFAQQLLINHMVAVTRHGPCTDSHASNRWRFFLIYLFIFD